MFDFVQLSKVVVNRNKVTNMLISFVSYLFTAQKKSGALGWPVRVLWAPHPLRASFQVQFRKITKPLFRPSICCPSGLVHGLWSAHSACPQIHWSQILSRRSRNQLTAAHGPVAPPKTPPKSFKKITSSAIRQMWFPILYGHLSRVRGPNFDYYYNALCEQHRNSFSSES